MYQTLTFSLLLIQQERSFINLWVTAQTVYSHCIYSHVCIHTHKYPEALGGKFLCSMSFSADPSCPGATGWGWCQHETELVFRGEITLSPITSLLQWAANTYFCLQYGTCHCRGTMSPPFPKFYYSITSLYAPRYLIEPLFSVPSTVQVSDLPAPQLGQD